MTSQIFLHIGPMKTGTTFLQQIMIDNVDQLAAAGCLFPGKPWGRQVRAAQDVLYSGFKDPKLQTATRGAWQAMAREMVGHEGPTCIFSMEFLSFAGAKQAERIVTTLRPAPIHVILTVRDAIAAIPAHWQTTVRSGRTTSWPDFMRAIRKGPGPLARVRRSSDPAFRFRRSQDVAQMLGVWRRQLPPERIHVVTVPPRGSEPRLLWDRFARVVGLDPDAYRSPASVPNTSLGYASAELLRRVNLELGEVLPTDYGATLRDHLATRGLAQRSAEETGPRLDRDTYAFALEWNRRTRQAVLDASAVVTGDLDDLPVTMGEGQGLDDAQRPPTEAELLSAAYVGVDSMRTLVARRTRRAQRQGIELGPAPLHSTDTESEEWERAVDPVSAAVAEIAELCRTAIDLRRSFRD